MPVCHGIGIDYMPVISTSFVNGLRGIINQYMAGTCIVYANTGSKDAMGIPGKIFTVERSGQTYPIQCSLQEVDRVPDTGEAGKGFQSNTEYNLKVPWGTLVEKGDQIVVTDDTGRQTRVHVLNPYRHTIGLTLTIRCKDIS